jgi:hypothetical protein
MVRIFFTFRHGVFHFLYQLNKSTYCSVLFGGITSRILGGYIDKNNLRHRKNRFKAVSG